MNQIFLRTCKLHSQTIQELALNWNQIKSHFDKNGFVILTLGDTHKLTALKVCRFFGRIQGHIRGPIDGIVDIRSQSVGQNSTQVISDLAFSAHTDGAYLEGMAAINGKVWRVGPPKMVALQCIQPAKQGGINFLVDGQRILSDILEKYPDVGAKLASLTAASICRDQHLIANQPIIQRMPTGLFALRFSYDNDLYATKEMMKVIKFFNRRYVENKDYITYLSLKEKDILVFDNHRYLHGRTAVLGDRFFRRIWIYDENSPSLLNPQGLPYFGALGKSTDAFKRFQPYLPVKFPFRIPKLEPILTGIKLEKALEKIICF